jgi:hypothetical protein
MLSCRFRRKEVKGSGRWLSLENVWQVPVAMIHEAPNVPLRFND